MRQQTTTEHQLEIRDNPRVTFRPAIAGMYRPAHVLLTDGMIQRALVAAQDAHVENYGDMHGVSFRVVSKTTTVSMLGPWYEFEDE